MGRISVDVLCPTMPAPLRFQRPVPFSGSVKSDRSVRRAHSVSIPTDGASMIIVSGRISTKPGRRDAFVSASREAVVAARRAPGCVDFVVAADPIESERVNVYEQWESEAQLEAFRGDGPGEDLSADIVDADVSRHQVASSGPA
jgi:quinol monooxygenase YgiN